MDLKVIVLRLMFVAFLLACCSPIAKGEDVSSIDGRDEALKIFIRSSYSIISETKDIPLPVLSILTSHIRSIADPGEPYQSTDQIDFSLPNARLIYAGSSNSSAFVFYVIGGFVRQRELLIAQMKDGAVRSYCYCAMGGLGEIGLEELKEDFSERMGASKCHSKTGSLNR